MSGTAAVLGFGFVGRAHIEALRRLGVTVPSILDSTSEREREARNALGPGVRGSDISNYSKNSHEELPICATIAKNGAERGWVRPNPAY